MTQSGSASPGCAVALVVIGFLILLPSGLCTTVMALNASRNDLALILLFGGPPILLGMALLLGGGFWLRKADQPPPEPPHKDS